MIIIAKKDSAFEQTVKKMFEKMTEGIVLAGDMVEKTVGIRPLNVCRIFHWGTISKLTPEFEFNPEDVDRINRKYLRKQNCMSNAWVPALRYKEGKEFNATFRKFAEKYEVTEDPLNEYGIYMVDWENGISYDIQLSHDTENNRYMLVCSDSIPRVFDKEKLAKDQFEIEY